MGSELFFETKLFYYTLIKCNSHLNHQVSCVFKGEEAFG